MRLALSIGFLATMLFLGAFGLMQGYLRFNYPSRAEFPVRGLDVSHHQAEIDWHAVRGQGFFFAYVKATEGGDFRDPMFAKHWQGAREAGLQVGAYHYFTFCKSGEEQARNFTAVVPQDADALPPVVDLEFGGNCSKTPTKEEMTRELAAFTALVTAHAGKPLVHYATSEFFDAYLAGTPQTAPLWIRAVFSAPRLPDGWTWTLWQYANRGRVDGVKSFVDMNAFHGDPSAWLAFSQGGGQNGQPAPRQ